MPRPTTDVVLFMRHLGRVMAGGARAVLDRANLYAGLGCRVTIVVVGPQDDAAAANLRRSGALPRSVRVLWVGRDAPDLAAHVEATYRQPLAPSVGSALGVVATDEPGRRKQTVRRSYRRAGVEVAWSELRSSGEPILFCELDDAGRVTRSWRYAPDGTLLVVDAFEPGSGDPVTRTFVVAGSLPWLEVDLTHSEGCGPAYHPYLGEAAGRRSFAALIAAWLDHEFRDSERLVVMADGENASQHVLRAMTHPRLAGVSILHNAHTGPPHDAQAPVKENWAAFLEDDRNVDLVVCLTARQRSHLEVRYPGMPLRVVHHAVPPTERDGVRRDPAKLVFVGRLAPQKRLDHLIDAFAGAAAVVPGARLDVYGSGPLLGELQARVAAAGLGDRVRFQGFTHDPASAFAAASAAVMTSLYEGLPLTLTEAMAVGTPFLAYDLDYGPAEVIRDGVDGLLVPPGDVAAMTAAMVRVLSDAALAESLSERARDVRERFSAERYADAWSGVLEDVLRTSSSPERADV